MCKKDSNPQASHSVRKLSTLSRECEPWNRSNDVQWCPSHELVRAPLCPLFGCLCDSFGCYRFLSPSYPTLVPRRSLDQIVRGSCCGNTSPLLLLVTLWECYLSFNCCNWHFVWVPSCLASKCSESKSFEDAFKSWGVQLQTQLKHRNAWLLAKVIRITIKVAFTSFMCELMFGSWSFLNTKMSLVDYHAWVGIVHYIVHLISISRQGLSCCRPMCRS